MTANPTVLPPCSQPSLASGNGKGRGACSPTVMPVFNPQSCTEDPFAGPICLWCRMDTFPVPGNTHLPIVQTGKLRPRVGQRYHRQLGGTDQANTMGILFRTWELLICLGPGLGAQGWLLSRSEPDDPLGFPLGGPQIIIGLIC